MGWESRVEEEILGVIANANNPLTRSHGNLILQSFLKYITHIQK